MPENTSLSDRVLAALAATATTFTLLVVSFAPPAANLTGAIA